MVTNNLTAVIEVTLIDVALSKALLYRFVADLSYIAGTVMWRAGFMLFENNKGRGKVFYGQEPPSGESSITECGVNYQLLAVIYRSSPMGNF